MTVVAPVAAITLSAAEQSAADGAHQLAFGAYVRPGSGQTKQQAVQALESQLGRTLGVSREFLLWDEAFPTTYHNWLRDGGRTLIVSAKAKRLNGTSVPWASIANATPGSVLHDELISWVDRLAAFGVPIYFTLSHEPEASTNLSLGTDAEFVAAWRKLVTIARNRNVTNVKFMWIMTDYAFSLPPTERRFADKWYPGDAWVDAAGIDPYNWNTCRPDTPNSWRSLATLIEPFRLWSVNHPNLELWLTEFASVEDPADPTRKSNWIDAARSLFNNPLYARFTGISYYHGEHPTAQYPLCKWWMNTSTNSLNASISLANDPLYGGSPTPTTTTTSTTTSTTQAPTTTAIVVVGDGANPAAGDVTVINRLTSRGFHTSVIDDAAVTAGASADVIVVSSSVDSNVFGTKLRTTASPVLTYKPFSLPKLGMTTDAAMGTITTATVDIVLAHPIAGGTGNIALTTTAKAIGWGTPAASADIIGTSSGKPTIFSYDKNDLLVDGSPAPSCRATLPMRHDSLTTATANMWAIFDAATDWANAC